MGELTPAQKRLRERQAAKAAQKAPELPDTLAGLNDGARHRTDADVEIDAVVDGLDPIECYRRWVGKMEPIDVGRAEGNKISCPIPGHTDAHPSAWLNTEKKTWFCGGCQRGGDMHDLAAWHHHFDVPGYKGPDFPKLRRQMAEDFGYHVRQTAGGSDYVVTPEPTDPDDPAPEPLSLVQFVEEPELTALSIDWRSILPEGTFLEKWMRATTVDDLTEEFYFWNGLLAVGLAAGRQAVFVDAPHVTANLFVCIYGTSGSGKSRSIEPLLRLLRAALPYDHTDPICTGTNVMPMPGSGEALLDIFSKPILDPNDPKKILGYGEVRGLINYNELKALMNKASTPSSTLKTHLIDFYDCQGEIATSTRGFGYVKAEHHFASFLTTTQPKAVRKLLLQEDADSGFINRWVFAAGPPKEYIALREDIIDIDPLVDPLNALRQWTSIAPRRVILAGHARAAYKDFFTQFMAPLKRSDDKPLLARSELLMKKLILLFAINEHTEWPSADLVERALSLWPYIERSYDLLGSEIGVGIQQDCRNKILDAVRALDRRFNKPPTVSEIVNRIRNNKFEPDLIKRTITVMIALGDIDEVPREGMRGPKSIGYRCA